MVANGLSPIHAALKDGEEDFGHSGDPHGGIRYRYKGSAPSKTINRKLGTQWNMPPNPGHIYHN